MAAELAKPGVEIIQQIRTVTPTVITPTLVPTVVGVCKQIVELFDTSSTGANVLNTDALVTLPGLFVAAAASGSPPAYIGLDGLTLVLSVNNAPNVTITFSDPTATGLTPDTIVSEIEAAFEAAGATGAVAETVGTNQFRVRTVGVGDLQQIYIDPSSSGTVLTAFGIGAGRTYSGISSYHQRDVLIPGPNFPDPRKNLSELAIQPESVRAFLVMGGGTNVREASRTAAFLRAGSISNAVVVTGTVTLSGLTLPGDVNSKTLVIKVNGGSPQTVTFDSGASSIPNLLGEINTHVTGLTATNTGGFLVLTSTSTGYTSTIELVSGTALSTLGLTAAVYHGVNIACVDDGNGDILSPLVEMAGQNFNSTGTSAANIGSVNVTALSFPSALDGLTLTVSGGGEPQTVTFVSPTNAAAVLTQLNAVLSPAAGGHVTATLNGSNFLVLTSNQTGQESMVEVVGGTAASVLGMAVGIQRGGPAHALAGDELWMDGVQLGIVRQVAPGGNTARLKLDRQLTISANIGTNFYIVANGLTSSPVSDRPLPELIVAPDGSASIKHEILRDTTGAPLSSTNGRASIYLSYNAIREDVTALAASPGLLRFDSTTQLQDQLSPISVDNPLALGLFFALTNAPGVQVTGLGVDAATDDSPFGTVEAFTRAAEFLEGYEVYAIAPLTHDEVVGQVFNTHVSFMSESTQKGERIAIFCSAEPTNKLDTLVASGTNGNSSGSGGTSFDTGVANISALLLNAGVSPVGTIPTSAGVYLDIEADDKHYSIQSINGSIVTVRTSFSTGTNQDGFYATTALNVPPLPSVLVSETFAVRIRGAALVNTDGTPDKNAIAATYQGLSQTFLNRRLWHIMPDTCAATIDGVEQKIPGFYLAAGIAGMIAQQPPQQSFTNFPMTGFTRVLGSNDTFSERQLNIMAAGGTYIVVQDTQNAPLTSRMALTTDVTSVETRTDSITKVVDFTAKFLRSMLKVFIGRFNITAGFLDSLSSVIQGGLAFLVENGILVGATLNNIIQDEDQPDTVLIDITLDPPYPCNYLRLTLVI